MKSRNPGFVFSSLIVLSLAWGVRAQPITQVAASAPTRTGALSEKAGATANADVTEAERQLRSVQVGYQSGINTFADVRNATIALAEAHIRAATAQNQSEGVVQNLELIETLRQEALREAEARYKSGLSAMADMNDARAGVAEAHIRVDLYTLVTIREEDLAQISRVYQTGATSKQEVDKASAALRDARSRFMQAQNSSAE